MNGKILAIWAHPYMDIKPGNTEKQFDRIIIRRDLLHVMENVAIVCADSRQRPHQAPGTR